MQQSLRSAIAQLEIYLAKLRAQPDAPPRRIAEIKKTLNELRDELEQVVESEAKAARLAPSPAPTPQTGHRAG